MRAALVASLVAAGALAGPARADAVFDFSGVCVGPCAGTATGVLRLSDSYVFGAALTSSDVLSMTLTSTTLSASTTSGGPLSVLGGLNADGTLALSGTFEITNSRFFFDFNGDDWRAGDGTVGDVGNGGVLTPAAPTTTSLPEPSILWMLLAIAPGLWYIARRARRR